MSAAAPAKAQAAGIAGAIRRRVSGERAGERVITAPPHHRATASEQSAPYRRRAPTA